MPARLRVNRDDIRPGIHKILYIPVRILYHQMHIKEHIRLVPYTFYDGHSVGDARHEHSVHDIYVNVLRSSLIYEPYIPLKV